jgi:tRNA1Val (adenine37-N6)-methyltransferase
MEEKNYSIDSIWDSSIKIQQSRKGYRFAIDSILLAHFLRLNVDEEALEIGCGNGIILILLSRLQKYKRLVGVEIQNELAALSRRNIRNNDSTNIEIVEADARHLENLLPKKAFHLLYSNPPYRRVGTGKLNPSNEKAIARHELRLTLNDLIHLGEEFLTDKGRLSVILPTFREEDWMNLLGSAEYFVQARRYIHSFPNTQPAFVLITAAKHKSAIDEMPALTIYEEPGKYTAEMAALLRRE